jgi:TfoX/Sxy family transcriptional regulator of competence genes
LQIPKPTDQDKDWFRSLVPDDPRVEIKPMFGNLAAFINGNMFMGLFGASIGVRLTEAHRESLLAVKGAGAFGPKDRPMKEYVSIPSSWRSSPAKVEPWTRKALEHTAAMRPKKK